MSLKWNTSKETTAQIFVQTKQRIKKDCTSYYTDMKTNLSMLIGTMKTRRVKSQRIHIYKTVSSFLYCPTTALFLLMVTMNTKLHRNQFITVQKQANILVMLSLS